MGECEATSSRFQVNYGGSLSPYINRFLSADTMVPGYANPQNLNRYTYVSNNPLRYTDPTGHRQCQTQEDCDEMGTTPMGQGASNKHRRPKPEKDKDDRSLKTVVPIGLCSGLDCPIGTTLLPSPYPNTLTYHPLDSTVIYDLPIYDYSYYPPKIIGNQTLAYTHDEFHFSLKNLLIPSDPITGADAAHSIASGLFQAGSKNLGALSKFIVPVCPECFTVLSVLAGIDSVNSAVTFDGHLETQVFYYTYQSTFDTPFDPKKMR